MDPVSAIGLVGAFVGIADTTAKCMRTLFDLKSQYKFIDFKIDLLLGQLSSFKAVLNKIADFPSSSLTTSNDEQLFSELSITSQGCEAIISVLDERLTSLERSKSNGLTKRSKVRFLWDEPTITNYQTLLNNQVIWLNCLLSTLQCGSSFEQRNQLLSKESRDLFSRVKDDTSSLLWLKDSESIGTIRSNWTQDLTSLGTSFDFDGILFSSKAYRMPTIHAIQVAANKYRSLKASKTVLDERRNSPANSSKIAARSEDPLKQGGSQTSQTSIFQMSCKFTYHAPLPLSVSVEVSITEKKYHDANRSHANTSNIMDSPKSLKSQHDLPRHIIPGPETPFEEILRADRGRQLTIPTAQGLEASKKLCLLGVSGSGKSTLFKSLSGQSYHHNSMTLLLYRSTIQEHTSTCIKYLLDFIADLHNISKTQYEDLREKYRRVGSLLSPTSNKKTYMFPDPLYDRTIETMATRGLDRLIHDWKVQWEVPGIRTLYGLRIFNDEAGPQEAEYFLNSYNRISHPHYIPTIEDIRRLPITTTGITEHPISFGNVVYKVVDPGGARAERRKWIHTIIDTEVVIFTFDISSYCFGVMEDIESGNFEEQVVIWESLIDFSLLQKANFIVIFTKVDRLTFSRLTRWPFSSYFPGFQGDPMSVDDILQNTSRKLASTWDRGEHKERSLQFRRCSINSKPSEIRDMILKAVQSANSG
ncbi:P-loop containing nucleoside triphosphate hydrolase protein [Hypoxylon sp. EC38]|nr:P-loop containing nucleoside triphosphate hydrolase protein [Hypoxylon sp. EC38]